MDRRHGAGWATHWDAAQHPARPPRRGRALMATPRGNTLAGCECGRTAPDQTVNARRAARQPRGPSRHWHMGRHHSRRRSARGRPVGLARPAGGQPVRARSRLLAAQLAVNHGARRRARAAPRPPPAPLGLPLALRGRTRPRPPPPHPTPVALCGSPRADNPAGQVASSRGAARPVQGAGVAPGPVQGPVHPYAHDIIRSIPYAVRDIGIAGTNCRV